MKFEKLEVKHEKKYDKIYYFLYIYKDRR